MGTGDTDGRIKGEAEGDVAKGEDGSNTFFTKTVAVIFLPTPTSAGSGTAGYNDTGYVFSVAIGVFVILRSLDSNCTRGPPIFTGRIGFVSFKGESGDASGANITDLAGKGWGDGSRRGALVERALVRAVEGTATG